MTNIFLLIFWIIATFVMWLLVIFAKVENPLHKNLENGVRSFFFWLAIVFTLIVGMLIK